MYKMIEMTNDELNIIAMEKDKRGCATLEAMYAQELIWNRRFQTRSSVYDDYEGWADLYDEKFQNYLDGVSYWDYLERLSR